MPSYTLDELNKMMEPQAQRDKALINQCIEGLGLYAAQQRRDSFFSSKPDEMRKLVENLVGYWGLDDGEHMPLLDDYLDAFDERIHAAKSGEKIAGGTYRLQTDTIYGLHRYGEEMVTAQGSNAMSEILDMSDLMKEIARYWDYEPYTVVDDLAARLSAEVRTMLEAIPLPGQPAIGENAGYEIKQAILFNNDRGFALAHSTTAPAPFVTWQFTYDANDSNKRSYYWGRYMSTEERARLNYLSRAADYMESNKVTEVPNPLTAAEMSREQNYNMIDGLHNNEAVPRADLTDGQTHEEILELAPETLLDENTSPEQRLQVLRETQPLVTVTFSEHEELRGVVNMPLYLADIRFARLDAMPREERSPDGAPYHKTDYRVDFIMNGRPDSFGGSYDVGNGDGSLIDHILTYTKYNRRDESYQQYLAGKDSDELELFNSRLDEIINELVPYFRTHCMLYEMEEAALSELIDIHETAAGQSSEADRQRIAYLESAVEYAGRCRVALNTTGLDGLPGAPQPAVEAAKEATACGTGEKASVLEQIREARTAPKPPAKSKPERERKSPELEL